MHWSQSKFSLSLSPVLTSALAGSKKAYVFFASQLVSNINHFQATKLKIGIQAYFHASLLFEEKTDQRFLDWHSFFYSIEQNNHDSFLPLPFPPSCLTQHKHTTDNAPRLIRAGSMVKQERSRYWYVFKVIWDQVI